MNKRVAAIVAAVVVAAGGIVAGGTIATSVGGGKASCMPPSTIMNSQIDGAIAAIETYIEANVASSFKKPAELDWAAVGVPIVKPGVIRGIFIVGEGSNGFGGFFGKTKTYTVAVERSCAGGDWTVTQFEAR